MIVTAHLVSFQFVLQLLNKLDMTGKMNLSFIRNNESIFNSFMPVPSLPANSVIGVLVGGIPFVILTIVCNFMVWTAARYISKDEFKVAVMSVNRSSPARLVFEIHPTLGCPTSSHINGTN